MINRGKEREEKAASRATMLTVDVSQCLFNSCRFGKFLRALLIFYCCAFLSLFRGEILALRFLRVHLNERECDRDIKKQSISAKFALVIDRRVHRV